MLKQFMLCLPCIMDFDDYHEIKVFTQKINEMSSGEVKLKFTAISSENDYGYRALFYIGNKKDKHNKSFLDDYKVRLKAFLKGT